MRFRKVVQKVIRRGGVVDEELKVDASTLGFEFYINETEKLRISVDEDGLYVNAESKLLVHPMASNAIMLTNG